MQESLAQIGIKTTINKIPGANWRTELNKKVLPLYTNVFSGWLDYPEYFFIWCYHGKNSIFNTMSYQSKEMDAMIDGAVDAAAVGNKADTEGREGLRRPRLSPTCRASRCSSLTSTSRCRRTSPATSTGSTAGSTIARWSRAKSHAARRRAAQSPFLLTGERQGVAPITRHGATRFSIFRTTWREPMLTVIAKRLLIAIPSLIGVVIVTFLLTRALPGDPAAYFAGPAATTEAIQEIRVKLGLDKSLPQQFARYVGDLAQGDLGKSLTTGQPVVTEIATGCRPRPN